MDISSWPLGKIMQLPDCCFGQRWPVSATQNTLGIAIRYGISMQALPEQCVIWELVYQITGTTDAIAYFDLRLSDVAPPDNFSWMAMERLIPGIGQITPEGENTPVAKSGGNYRLTMKKPVQTSGQRICGRFEFIVATPAIATATVIVSSVPKEVPDCVVSDILSGR